MAEDTNDEGQAETTKVETVDIDDEEAWLEEPIVTFGQQASLQIARWVLMIFAGVYTLCFIMAFILICAESATFDGGIELVKFLLTAVLPLVTLAVGYYLGDRNSSESL